MCHVYHEDCADFVSKSTHTRIVPLAGIGACASYNETRAFAACHFFHLFIVDTSVFFAYIVLKSLKHETGEVYRASVAEMTAMAEVEAEKLIAGIQYRHENSHIGLCP